eukprot:SM017248S03210  [mRNA]  locus=s17248:42:176:- [translate_table: standard]
MALELKDPGLPLGAGDERARPPRAPPLLQRSQGPRGERRCRLRS